MSLDVRTETREHTWGRETNVVMVVGFRRRVTKDGQARADMGAET